MPEHYVGEKFIVFTSSATAGIATSTRCIITAHGERKLTGSSFVVPEQTSVVFYCPHGTVLTHSSIPEISEGTLNEYDRVTGGNSCKDYSLTKFAGYHGDSLTNVTPIDKALSAIPAAKKSMTAFTYDDLRSAVQFRDNIWDVVSVRYRPFKFDATLSECIEAILGAGYAYQEFHADFCRNHPFAINPPKHDARTN